MLARIQRAIVGVLVIAAGLGIAFSVHLARPWIAAVFPVVVLAGYAGVLAAEFQMLGRSYVSWSQDRPLRSDLVKAWIGEMLAAPRAFLWRQPFLQRAVPDNLSDVPRGRRGVVLVHGLFCNRALWNPWLRKLSRRQVPFIAVNLEPVLGSIDDYRATISAAVHALREATHLAPVVVAHSMGGLAVRAWLATEKDVTIAHRIVTIASPHSGTRMAGRGVARNVGEMRIASAWLADLWGRESATTRARFICFWGHCDNIVFPTRTATLPEADNRHLRATAHVQMALHPAVLETVLELVA